MNNKKSISAGFTMIEIMITLTIIAILAISVGLTLTGLQQKQKLSEAANQIKTEINMIRSRAITYTRTQRLHLLTTTTYQLEEYNGTAWVATSTVKTMPVTTAIRASDVTTKSVSLEFQTNGLPAFNGATTAPFLTVNEAPTTDLKGIYIGSGGVVTIGAGQTGP